MEGRCIAVLVGTAFIVALLGGLEGGSICMGFVLGGQLVGQCLGQPFVQLGWFSLGERVIEQLVPLGLVEVLVRFLPRSSLSWGVPVSRRCDNFFF